MLLQKHLGHHGWLYKVFGKWLRWTQSCNRLLIRRLWYNALVEILKVSLNSDVSAGRVVDMGFGAWVCTCEGFCKGFRGFVRVKTLKLALNPKKWFFLQRSTTQPPHLKDKPMWARFEEAYFVELRFLWRASWYPSPVVLGGSLEQLYRQAG